VEIEMMSITIRPFVEDLRKLFLPLAEAKKIALTCTVGAGVPEAVLSDELRLRQIISNLLANAIKFTESGSVTLSVQRDPNVTTGAPARILFAVTDTGIGIPAAAMGRLFKPYTQADPSIARKFGGSGLGLSISLHFAKLLGGRITVKSEEGKGSTFTLEIIAEASRGNSPPLSAAPSVSAS
jgi:signal transduction histidine kinase